MKPSKVANATWFQQVETIKELEDKIMKIMNNAHLGVWCNDKDNISVDFINYIFENVTDSGKQGEYIGYLLKLNELLTLKEKKAELIKEIDNLIRFREKEETNNNIFTKGSDENNEDFIENLESLKKKVEEVLK